MQATARRLSVESATSCARRRLIRDVRPRTKSIVTMTATFEAPYPITCGHEAAEIISRLLPYVRERREYLRLRDILASPSRWREGHDVFDAIRSKITLVRERLNRPSKTADDYFVYIAECAAQTAFNCTATDTPFDDDSYDWLLHLERDFVSRSFPLPPEQAKPWWRFW